MFVPMIKAIDAYIDNRVTTFLARPLANTGLPPHYYVTADESPNIEPSNSNLSSGKWRKTSHFLDTQPVYEKSYGTGGTGNELTKKILKDLKRHGGVEDERILFMAGKVTDGQYINEGFVERMFHG